MGTAFFIAAVAWSAFPAFRRLAASPGATIASGTNGYDAWISRGIAIVSTIQGGLIVASIVVLGVLGRHVWILPVVALIVVVHFFAMPAIFGRTIDYYLGAVMPVVAGVGLYIALEDRRVIRFRRALTPA